MKNRFGLIFLVSLVFAVIFFGLVVREENVDFSAVDPQAVALFFLIVLCAAFVCLLIIYYLARIHFSIGNSGLRRLLLATFVVAAPAFLYIGYEVEYVNSLADHIYVSSVSIGASYVAVIVFYMCVKWIVDGFCK